MGRKVLTCFLLLLAVPPGFSQSRADTSFLNAAKKNAVALYEQELRSQSRLYNGSKYVAPEHTLEQHPFLASPDWLVGAAFYDGEYFENIALMYDLHRGALITEHLPSGHPIQLVREKLKYFSIEGHYFERIEKDSVSNTLPQSGFYHVLYDGKTRLVARRQKILHEHITSSVIERSFDERTRYFIYRNSVYFPVKSKASLLKVLADKKTEVKRFIKQNRLPFSLDREILFKKVAEFYDSLK